MVPLTSGFIDVFHGGCSSLGFLERCHRPTNIGDRPGSHGVFELSGTPREIRKNGDMAGVCGMRALCLLCFGE